MREGAVGGHGMNELCWLAYCSGSVDEMNDLEQCAIIFPLFVIHAVMPHWQIEHGRQYESILIIRPTNTKGVTRYLESVSSSYIS